MKFVTPNAYHAKDLKNLFSQLTGEKIESVDIKALQNAQQHYLVLENEGKAIGFGALISYHLPTIGEVGRLEDIVVDENYHGQGLGEKLVVRLVEIAKENNLQKIQLTSSPRRIAARRLYQKIGFEMKDTNVFVMNLA